MEYTLYCIYHNQVWPELYGEHLNDVVFVKLGCHNCSFTPANRLDLTAFSTFRPMGRHFAEYEFYYNLYRAAETGEYDLPEYFGIIHYDMLPTSIEGIPIWDYLKSLSLHPRLVVGFAPYSMQYCESQGLRLSGEDCYVAILRDYNNFYGTNKHLHNTSWLPLCGAILQHKSSFMSLMRFLVAVLEGGLLDFCNVGQREQGGFLERYVAVHMVLQEGLDLRQFPLWHSFRECTGSTPISHIASRAGMNMKASTFLNALVNCLGYKSYLEIGSGDCATLDAIKVPRKVGVDLSHGAGGRDTSDGYFRCNTEKFDLIFIDGLHHSEQVLEDAHNAIKHLSTGGAVVVHDCLPQLESHQFRTSPVGDWTGDVWKAMVALRTDPNVDAATFNSEWGYGVIVPRPNSSLLCRTVTDDLSWEHFQRDKHRLLRTMDYYQIMAFVMGRTPVEQDSDSSNDLPDGRHSRQIVSAIYGHGDNTVDITGIIKTFAVHKCYEFLVSNALAGDPCENVQKRLLVSFDDGCSITCDEGTVVSLEPLLMHTRVRQGNYSSADTDSIS